MVMKPEVKDRIISHEQPVIGAIYNRKFNQVRLCSCSLLNNKVMLSLFLLLLVILLLVILLLVILLLVILLVILLLVILLVILLLVILLLVILVILLLVIFLLVILLFVILLFLLAWGVSLQGLVPFFFQGHQRVCWFCGYDVDGGHWSER